MSFIRNQHTEEIEALEKKIEHHIDRGKSLQMFANKISFDASKIALISSKFTKAIYEYNQALECHTALERYWSSSKLDTSKAKVYSLCGDAYLDKIHKLGNRTERKSEVKYAMLHYNKALELDPHTETVDAYTSYLKKHSREELFEIIKKVPKFETIKKSHKEDTLYLFRKCLDQHTLLGQKFRQSKSWEKWRQKICDYIKINLVPDFELSEHSSLLTQGKELKDTDNKLEKGRQRSNQKKAVPEITFFYEPNLNDCIQEDYACLKQSLVIQHVTVVGSHDAVKNQQVADEVELVEITEPSTMILKYKKL